MADYKWKPIEDLPDDWTKLASSELGGLAAVWVEHYETIKDSKALKQFNERLRREWAIETGIIENLYYIDRGVTLTLIEKGIEASLIPHGSTDRPAELIVPMLKDHEEVVTGLFDFVGQQRQLSTSYIKQLHQALTQHQRTTAAKDSFGNMVEVELLRGEWKRLPNNPTKSDGSLHEYCPPEQVASEMDHLILLHQEHLEEGVPPEVEAAWLHHRFTQIHPFQDGNGRMARTLASLIFLRAGLFPLVIHRDKRDEYIDALEVADNGELRSVTEFFLHAQKKAINQALSLSENILLEDAPIEQIIEAAVYKIKDKRQRQFQEAKLITKLGQIAFDKLDSTAKTLNKQLQTLNENYEAQARPAGHDKVESLLFYEPAKKIADEAGYEANFAAFSQWLALEIKTDFNYKLVVSFHGLGQSELIAISAFGLPPPDYQRLFNLYRPLCRDVFQFTNNEQEQEVINRFHNWLDEVVLIGLNHWRQQL